MIRYRMRVVMRILVATGRTKAAGTSFLIDWANEFWTGLS